MSALMERNARAGAAVPSLSGARDRVSGRVFCGPRTGGGLGMTQARCVYCSLHLYRRDLSSTSRSSIRPRRLGVPALAASRPKARTKPLGCWTSGRGHLWGEWPWGCLLCGSLCTAISALQQQLGGISNITDLGVTSGSIPHSPSETPCGQLEGHSEKCVSQVTCWV